MLWWMGAAAMAAPPLSTTWIGPTAWRAGAAVEQAHAPSERVWVQTEQGVQAFDSDGRSVASWSPCEERAWGVAVSPDGARVAVDCGQLQLLDTATGDVLAESASEFSRTSMAWLADGRLAYVTRTVIPGRDAFGPDTLVVRDADGAVVHEQRGTPFEEVVAWGDGLVARQGSTVVALGADLTERWRHDLRSDGYLAAAGDQVCLVGDTLACANGDTGSPGATLDGVELYGELTPLSSTYWVGDAFWTNDHSGQWRRWPLTGSPELLENQPAHGLTALVPWGDRVVGTHLGETGVSVFDRAGALLNDPGWSIVSDVAFDPTGSWLALTSGSDLYTGPVAGPLALVPGAYVTHAPAIAPDGSVLIDHEGDEEAERVAADGTRSSLDTPLRMVGVAFDEAGTGWVLHVEDEGVGWMRVDPTGSVTRVDTFAPDMSASRFDLVGDGVALIQGRTMQWNTDRVVAVTLETGAALDKAGESDCGSFWADGQIQECTDGDQVVAMPGGPSLERRYVHPSPTGAHYVVHTYDEHATRVRDGRTHKVLGRVDVDWDGHPAPWWSPDGRWLAIPGRDGRLAVVELLPPTDGPSSPKARDHRDVGSKPKTKRGRR